MSADHRWLLVAMGLITGYILADFILSMLFRRCCLPGLKCRACRVGIHDLCMMRERSKR